MPLRIRHNWLSISAILLFTLSAHAHEISAPETASRIFQAAETLLNSLSPEQRRSASFPFNDDDRYDWHYTPRKRSGLALGEYLSSLPPEIARQRINVIRNSAMDQIHFGWAGSVEPGRPHYYRIQGTTFLIEYDNVQNGANHTHTVGRDFDGGFGRNLLREHYRAAHH